MYLDDYIALNIRSFAPVLPHRPEALTSLYLSYGAGMFWKDGKLACTHDHHLNPERGYLSLASAKENHARACTMRDELITACAGHPDVEKLRNTLLPSQIAVEQLTETLENVDAIVEGTRPQTVRGPLVREGMLNKAAAIFHVPDNAEPDYLLGAFEALLLLWENPNETEEVRAQAQTLLSELSERFGEPPQPNFSYITWEQKAAV